VPGPVTQVLLRALAKSPAERYDSAADLEKALLAARGAPAAAQRPHTIALVRSALALEPEPMETTPLPALPPTPVPAAVATAVPVAVPTLERRAYAGPSPRERAARSGEDAPRRGGLFLGVVALAIAGAGAAAWKNEARLRTVLGLDASPSPLPSAAALVAPASTAPRVVASLPPPGNIVPVAPSPAASPRPSAAASVVPGPVATVAPATPVPSAAAPTPAATAAPSAATASVDRAEALFAQGRFASALAEAKAVLEREPGNTQAQQLAEDAEVELMVEKRLKEAREAAAAGDRDLAIERLKLGLAAKPTDSRLLALWRELTGS
jgi:tetratricopeptide (TPR) repeat protein